MIFDKLKEYGKDINITLIIHLIIYLIISFISSNVFVSVLMIDSIINAIQYLKALYENHRVDVIKKYNIEKLQENDIIAQKIKKYVEENYPEHLDKFEFNNEGYVDTSKKYLLYTTAQITSIASSYIFWQNNHIINMALSCVAMPIVHIFLISNIYFNKMFTYIKKKIKRLLIYISSKTTAYFINLFSESCLNISPKIDYIELSAYYENIYESIPSTFMFVKTVVIQTIIHYFKKNNNTVYSYIVDFFHKFQVQSYKTSGLSHDAKLRQIGDIVRKRKWEDFHKPRNINMIFEVLDRNNVYSTKLELFIINIQINILRFMTIWSLSSLSPLLAISIDIYFSFFNQKFNLEYDYIPYGLSALFVYANKLIGVGMMIASNIIMKPIIEYIKEKEYFEKYIIGPHNKEQLFYLLFIPVMWKLGLITLPIIGVIYYINKNKTMNGLLCSATLISYLSNYSLIHIILLIPLTIITNNIIIYKPENIPIDSIIIIDDYMGNNWKINNQDKNKKHVTIRNNKIIKHVEEDNSYNSELDHLRKNTICEYVSNYFNSYNIVQNDKIE